METIIKMLSWLTAVLIFCTAIYAACLLQRSLTEGYQHLSEAVMQDSMLY